MSVGYLFSGVLGHLPLLAVLIAGFVLIAARRERLGPRRVLFARLGLGALLFGSLLQLAWTILLATVYSRLDYSALRYGLLFSGFGLVTALLSAAGVGLLIAAVVTRNPGPGFAGATAIARRRRVMAHLRTPTIDDAGKPVFAWSFDQDTADAETAADTVEVFLRYKDQPMVERRYGEFIGPLAVARSSYATTGGSPP